MTSGRDIRLLRSLVKYLTIAVVVAVSAATLLGALAVLYPYLELINHFRLALLAASAAAVPMAFWAGARKLRLASVCLLLVNVLFGSAPLIAQASSAAQPSLRVTTFNVWINNPKPQKVVDYLRETDADIVVLQEVGDHLEQVIVPPLRDKYPHVVSCARRNCGLAMLSKTAWLDAGSSDRTRASPPIVWARFAGATKPYVVTGLHLAFPFQPDMQVDHMNWLADRAQRERGTQIVVGDFNLSPFSFKLNAFAQKANLRQHALLGASWPGHRFVPVVLIDNLLASPDVKAVKVSYGPQSYGSDHYPLTFDIALE